MLETAGAGNRGFEVREGVAVDCERFAGVGRGRGDRGCGLAAEGLCECLVGKKLVDVRQEGGVGRMVYLEICCCSRVEGEIESHVHQMVHREVSGPH